MRKGRVFLVVLAFLSFLGLNAQSPSGHRTVVVLMDLSLSCSNAGLFPYYREDFEKVLKGLGFGDTIVVATITGDSSAELDLPVNETLPVLKSNTDNPLVLRGMQEEAESQKVARIKAIAKKVDGLLQSKPQIKSTDLFGGMEMASRVFKSYPNPNRVLIVLSDMQQDADGVDFYRNDLSNRSINAIIKKLQAQGQLPDLTGTRILVACAQPPNSNVSRYRSIRSFWIAYFGACHARLDPSDYGAALIRLAD